jgi:hypothetical protein
MADAAPWEYVYAPGYTPDSKGVSGLGAYTGEAISFKTP